MTSACRPISQAHEAVPGTPEHTRTRSASCQGSCALKLLKTGDRMYKALNTRLRRSGVDLQAMTKTPGGEGLGAF